MTLLDVDQQGIHVDPQLTSGRTYTDFLNTLNLLGVSTYFDASESNFNLLELPDIR
ncbi:hypothetical protein [Acaryochloris marina]|uniref:hypothetical protein n=1 Tax=Acaryochloris marina TaxID=155978 RepID=UPI0021C2AD92|nr:hypothetical protein [Acaryochloris marina]BDM83612.1 hypothetical protein AM10699_64730 [Acaryochloris marina MBIC10699]